MQLRLLMVVAYLTLTTCLHLTHQQPSPQIIHLYFEGRTMKVNKCYNLLKDKQTVFKIHPKQIIIQACNTHICQYTLEQDLTFIPLNCRTSTSNDCPTDNGPAYEQALHNSAKVKLNANYITFLDHSLQHATLQLKDTPEHNPDF